MSTDRVRFVVPMAIAILLTFGLGGMSPFEGKSTVIDQAMKVFFVLVAPIFAFKDIYMRFVSRNLYVLLLMVMLLAWIFACVLLDSPMNSWHLEYKALALLLPLLMASQISRTEIGRLRRMVLSLGGLFSVHTIIFGQNSLHLIFSGMLATRLGDEFSPANVIIFPRVMYLLILTCIISIALEKNVWLKIVSLLVIPLPLLIAFATGGRGPLLAFVVTLLLLTLFLLGTKQGLVTMVTVATLIIAGYFALVQWFPLMSQRLMESQNDSRIGIWLEYLHKPLTLFGYGPGENYPHNVFLEFIYDYGIIGTLLFILLLVVSLLKLYKYYDATRNKETIWILSVFSLQLSAQQLSLDIFYAGFWAAILLPMGLHWKNHSLWVRNQLFAPIEAPHSKMTSNSKQQKIPSVSC